MHPQVQQRGSLSLLRELICIKFKVNTFFHHVTETLFPCFSAKYFIELY